MKMAHPKTNIRRTFLAKLCFDFMTDILTIELGFSQQVAAESVTNPSEHSEKCRFAMSARVGVERQDLRSAPGKICVLSAPTQKWRNYAHDQVGNSSVKIYRREAEQYQQKALLMSNYCGSAYGSRTRISALKALLLP